jgi:hypothetical protein
LRHVNNYHKTKNTHFMIPFYIDFWLNPSWFLFQMRKVFYYNSLRRDEKGASMGDQICFIGTYDW